MHQFFHPFSAFCRPFLPRLFLLVHFSLPSCAMSSTDFKDATPSQYEAGSDADSDELQLVMIEAGTGDRLMRGMGLL